MGDRGRRKLIGMGNRIIVWDKPKIGYVRVVCVVVCSTRRNHGVAKGGGLFLEENRSVGGRSGLY